MLTPLQHVVVDFADVLYAVEDELELARFGAIVKEAEGYPGSRQEAIHRLLMADVPQASIVEAMQVATSFIPFTAADAEHVALVAEFFGAMVDDADLADYRDGEEF